MSIFTKIDKHVTQRSVAIITFLITLIIVFNPLLLPLRISSPTQGFIDRLNALPAGSRIVWSGSMDIAWYINRRTGLGAVADYIFSKGLKIIFFPGTVESVVYMQDIITYINPQATYGYEYGKQWVILEPLLGGEPAAAQFATNMKYSTVDSSGNDITNMPIMQGIAAITDIPLAIVVSYTFTDYLWYIRQWASPYKVPLLYISQYALIAEYFGIYVFGDLDWVSGLAEFEYATKRAAEEVINLDVRNTIIYFLFSAIIVGAVANWQITRKTRIGKEVKG
jgi:hypothetical protein